ncbi:MULTISPECIES: hypothetical protein [unclassified Aminobacter]|jgi:surface antigen|uniref:hypothetical protein n=1 Tax=unclassified Aminobacter TaxID=2644704 RepID=UPI0009FEC6F9|nr:MULTISPECIES: hypothetical protein [unclassified Aminobacter]
MNHSIAAVVVLVALLSACSTTGSPTASLAERAFAGSSRPVSTAIVEAMAGGLIARTPGVQLDSRERRRALEAEYRALEYMPAGQSVSWGRPGGSRGEVVAGSPYRVGSQDCRQYTHTVYAGPAVRSTRGTACRNPDGSWTLLA